MTSPSKISDLHSKIVSDYYTILRLRLFLKWTQNSSSKMLSDSITEYTASKNTPRFNLSKPDIKEIPYHEYIAKVFLQDTHPCRYFNLLVLFVVYKYSRYNLSLISHRLFLHQIKLNINSVLLIA